MHIAKEIGANPTAVTNVLVRWSIVTLILHVAT